MTQEKRYLYNARGSVPFSPHTRYVCVTASAFAATQLHKVENVSAEVLPLVVPRLCQSQQHRSDLHLPSNGINSPSLQASVTLITLQIVCGCVLNLNCCDLFSLEGVHSTSCLLFKLNFSVLAVTIFFTLFS